ncbi:MAG: hypothetical protein KO316_09510 [Methanobacterium sp.]|jgi:hypothetical protein|nr:hypothetical protein [Methanobacterium sp.]
MSQFKVNSHGDNKKFVSTDSFQKMNQLLKSLKQSKGHFVIIVGTPGTGKSTNIYHSINNLDLNVYDAFLFLDDAGVSNSKVFQVFWDTLGKDMGTRNHDEIYQKASEYDFVLFADKFSDSQHIKKDKVGMGLWTENRGFSTFPFYFRILWEYLNRRTELKKVNIVTQAAWILKVRGIRYDILTDFSFISRTLMFFLKQFFEVVRISYSEEEIMKIVKIHFPALEEEEIKYYIKKCGRRPRFIFESISHNEKNR